MKNRKKNYQPLTTPPPQSSEDVYDANDVSEDEYKPPAIEYEPKPKSQRQYRKLSRDEPMVKKQYSSYKPKMQKLSSMRPQPIPGTIGLDLGQAPLAKLQKRPRAARHESMEYTRGESANEQVDDDVPYDMQAHLDSNGLTMSTKPLHHQEQHFDMPENKFNHNHAGYYGPGQFDKMEEDSDDESETYAPGNSVSSDDDKAHEHSQLDDGYERSSSKMRPSSSDNTRNSFSHHSHSHDPQAKHYVLAREDYSSMVPEYE